MLRENCTQNVQEFQAGMKVYMSATTRHNHSNVEPEVIQQMHGPESTRTSLIGPENVSPKTKTSKEIVCQACKV